MSKEAKKEGSNEISWRAAEYQYVKKDVGWYWIIVIIASILVFLSLTQGNFFFAVFIVIAAAVLIFFSRRRPQVFDFRITDKGIAIGENIFYDYERLEGFTLRKRPERLDELIFKRKTAFNPYVKVPIDSTLAEKATSVLREKLPEIEYQESLIEIISEWLGF